VLEMVDAFEKASGKVNVYLPYIQVYLCAVLHTKNEIINYLIYWILYLQKIPVKLCPRRAGDATEVYASTEKAEKELGWK
jgi:hypothetical protein